MSPHNPQQAMQAALRYERAQQMLTDGYHFDTDADTGTVFVCKPGETAAAYWIGDQLPGQRDGCSCADFQKRGEPCKHMMFVELCQTRHAEEEAELAAICAAWEDERARLRSGLTDALLPEPFALDATPAQQDAEAVMQRFRGYLLAEYRRAERGAKRTTGRAEHSWRERERKCEHALEVFDQVACRISLNAYTPLPDVQDEFCACCHTQACSCGDGEEQGSIWN